MTELSSSRSCELTTPQKIGMIGDNTTTTFQDENYGAPKPPVTSVGIPDTSWAQRSPAGSFVNGNQVRYAVAFTNASGEESELGPWGDWKTIDGFALPLLTGIPTDPTRYTLPAAATTGRSIYRQFNVATAQTSESTNSEQSRWMVGIESYLNMTEIFIPGTHDSGTYSGDPGSGTRCQSKGMTIKEQLRLGIRFLDIRCKIKDDGFGIYHGDTYLDLTFSQVQQDCINFLATFPSETVFMSVKNEGDDAAKAFEDMFIKLTQQQLNRWYQGKNIPSLGQARGKIILLRRFREQNLNFGISPQDWNDNDWTYTTNANDPSENLIIQDNYNVTQNPGLIGTLSMNQKYQNVQKMIVDSAFYVGPPTLFINFCSGTLGLDPSPAGVANGSQGKTGVNVNLNNFLQRKFLSCRPSGVLPMDFPNEQPGLIANIIAQNQLPRYVMPDVAGRVVNIHPYPDGSSPKLIWEVEGSSTKTGAAIQLWVLDSSAKQGQWVFEKLNGRNIVRIKNINSNLYLSAKESPIKEGNHCIQGEINTGGGDRTDSGDETRLYISTYTNPATGIQSYILWNASGRYGFRIEFEDGKYNNGVKMQFWNSGTDRTCWTLQPV